MSAQRRCTTMRGGRRQSGCFGCQLQEGVWRIDWPRTNRGA